MPHLGRYGICLALLSIAMFLVGARVYGDDSGAYRRISPIASSRIPSLSGPLIADGLGVAVRRPSASDFSRIASMGLKVVRMDMNWESVEVKRGVFNFENFRRYAIESKRHGIKIMFILDYGNKLYDDEVRTQRHGVEKFRARAPAKARSVQAFSGFARAAAAALREYDPIWEIWNEPDNTPFWPPKPDVGAYVRLAEAACRAIRVSDPGAKILGPAAAQMSFDRGTPPALLDGVLKSQLPKCLDAISVHPYKMTGSLVVDEEIWRRASSLRTDQSKIPFANSEWGKSVVSPETLDGQASYLVKTLSTSLGLGVRINVWYNWRDFESYNESESSFGLLNRFGLEKPSAAAFGQFAHAVGAYTSASMFQVGSGVLVKFTKPGGRSSVWVAWSSGAPLNLAAPAEYRFSELRDLYGRRLALSDFITVHREPVYITLIR